MTGRGLNLPVHCWLASSASTGKIPLLTPHSESVVGNPAAQTVRMGALASLEQREEVRRSVKELAASSHIVYGDPEQVTVVDADPQRGAFLSPLLLRCDDSGRAEPHTVEAFGPVSTVIGYRDTADAIAQAARGRGSLVGSVVTGDPDFAGAVVIGVAPWHGRILVLDQTAAAVSTGHEPPPLVLNLTWPVPASNAYRRLGSLGSLVCPV